MREDAIPDDESQDPVEILIQSRWNQFANPNRSADLGSLPKLLSPTQPTSTDKIGSPRQSRAWRFLVREGKGRVDRLKPTD